jgi:hypothetical protein
MSDGRPRRRRRVIGLVLTLAVLAGLVPFGAALGDHTVASRVEVTFTSTLVEITNPGEEWVDEAGIFHLRGQVETDDVTGDLTGSAEVVINVDANEAEGWQTAWGTFVMADETGTWSGRWLNNVTVVEDEVFESGFMMLSGRGSYAGMTIAGGLTLGDADDATIEGVMQTMALPTAGLTMTQDLCFQEDGSISGGFFSNGAVETSGSSQAAFEASGGIWTHTYNLFGLMTFTDAHGSFSVAFLGGAQDGETYSGSWGPFMILGGDGAYAELYGNGRAVMTAAETSTCATGVGFRISSIGIAHFNSAIAPLEPIAE